MDARPATKYDPDVISAERPLADAIAVKSRIEGLIGNIVEPGLKGVKVAAVFQAPGSKAGFVLVHVPPTDGFPARSRKDDHFYQRIASGTYRMEYFQLADMFGRRHRPSLELYLEEPQLQQANAGGVLYVDRLITFGLRNVGRAVARFPSIRVRGEQVTVYQWGIDGNGTLGLPQLATDDGWFIFGGGVDHVIHPGTSLRIARLQQRARLAEWQPVGLPRKNFIFAEVPLSFEIHADDVGAKTETRIVPARETQV